MEIKTQIKPDRLASFRAAYLENGLNAYQACIAIGISKSRARANAYKYARLVNLQLKEALRAIGVDEASQAADLKKLLRSKSERIRLDAIKEVNRILDAYPAPKPDTEPMTFQLVIDMKV